MGINLQENSAAARNRQAANEDVETKIQIELADQDEAFALFGRGDELLQVLRECFACRMIGRGMALELSGSAHETELAAEAARALQQMHRVGTRLTTHEVRYVSRLVHEGRASDVVRLQDTILVTARGHAVRAKTIGQLNYISTIKKNAVTIAIGPAGTGKTYLAVVMAVAALRNKEVTRIILTRPAVEAGERLGFLPGDLQDKVDPYLRPLYDALQDILGGDAYMKLMSRGLIEIAPLAYMRGRTLADSFIILAEAQNTTESQMKMFLTRLGFGARMVVTGDLSQIDLPRGVSSGLRVAAEVLADVKGIAVLRLSPVDVVRHDVVTRIINAYGQYDAQRKKKQEQKKKAPSAGSNGRVRAATQSSREHI